jgi:hypothetical protein
MKKEVKNISIGNLEPFTPEEVNRIKQLTNMPEKGLSEWQFHHPDDEFYSKTYLKNYNKEVEKWYGGAADEYPELSPPILGMSAAGFGEYYIFKKNKKFYTVASNKFEYSGWFMGGDLDTASKIHEFTDIGAAIKFVKEDVKVVNKKINNAIKNRDQYQLTETELISPYEADEIFEKFGVKNAMLLSKEDLKKAYRNLAIKHHPDRGGNEANMKQINAAYESLKVNDGSGKSGGTVKPTSRNQETQEGFDFLFSIKDELEKKLNSKKLPIQGKVGISITEFNGGWMQVSFRMKNGDVGLFDIVKRGQKMRVHNPLKSDDEKLDVKDFSLNDIDGVVDYIKNTIDPIQIQTPPNKKIN